jgi:membrane protein
LRRALLNLFRQVLPPDASALVVNAVRQLNARTSLGPEPYGQMLLAVWGALNGTSAIMDGLNKAYGIEEERPWWRVLAITLGLTISLCILGLIALTAILYGDRAGRIVGEYLGVPAHFEFLWRIMQWAVMVMLLLFSLAVLYRFGPNLRDRRWQWSIPGAVVAVTLWVASTLLLRVYQEQSSSSQMIYGGLNPVATLLLWLYLSGAAIFIGGEVNSQIEKAAAEAGHPDVRKPGQPRSGGKESSR